MDEEEKDKTEELEFEILQIANQKLTIGEYKKIEQIINLERRFKNELKRERERIKASREREDKYYSKYNDETKESKKWKSFYEEVCIKYAKLEIELDIANIKIKHLEGENRE